MKSIDALLFPAAFLTISVVISAAAMYLTRKKWMGKSAEHLVMVLFIMISISLVLMPSNQLIAGLLLIAQFVTVMLCHRYPIQDAQQAVADIIAKKKRDE